MMLSLRGLISFTKHPVFFIKPHVSSKHKLF
jgi:hypothetical protein